MAIQQIISVNYLQHYFICFGSSVFISLFIALTCPSWVLASNYSKDNFFCGGRLERELWSLWDDSAKNYLLTRQIDSRLKEQGDTYSLYDLQTYSHNLVAMARRCSRLERLEEMADVFGTAYSVLEVSPSRKSGLAWICRGGSVCNSKNRLIDKEVMLTSLQFLALVSSLSNGLAQESSQSKVMFIEETVMISMSHLLRWGDVKAIQKLDQLIKTKASDIKDGSSEFLFTDKHLWMIAIYADLAGIFMRKPDLLSKTGLSAERLSILKEHFRLLLRLLAARVTVTSIAGRNGSVKVATLDPGFWRLYAYAKYAGYTGTERPMDCLKQNDIFIRLYSPLVDIPDPVDDIGWDLSHSRRLVHVFDAIERNRDAVQHVFEINDEYIPEPQTIRAFSGQLVERVWNGDSNFPLFSNYWSGANGWYRVDYDNGTSRCLEGYPPFGLTDAFITGGYISWGRYNPEIYSLGRRLYILSKSDYPNDRKFMESYYSRLGVNGNGNTKMLMQLMFWPSLVVRGH